MMMRALLGIVIAVFASGLIGQPEAAAPAFEVASVKPADPNSRRGMDFRTAPGGSLTVTNLTLQTLVQEAYGVERYRIAGGPKWLDSDRFDIAAKAEGDPNRKQMMAMLQTLLADRFQLKVRRETREGNVYALVVAKNAPKLQEPTSGDQSYIRLSIRSARAAVADQRSLWPEDLYGALGRTAGDRIERSCIGHDGDQAGFRFQT